jgi:hypothetical protein
MVASSRLLGRLVFSALILSVLAACDDSVPIACPDVGIIKDASVLTQIRPGPGRDPLDIAYRAEMTAARLECSFNDDMVETKVTFGLNVTRGPQAGSDQVNLPYFVAVVSTDETKLVTKRQFEMNVAFDGKQTVRVVQTVPGDATLVPRPAGLLPGRSSIGGGPAGNPNQNQRFNLSGATLNAAPGGGGGGGGSGGAPPRRPGTILPGVQGAVPYQVLIGFQLDENQLKYNREQIR